MRNHGHPVKGPWVVGFYQSQQQVLFELVEEHSSTTLIPLFKKYVKLKSSVITDEWKGYLPLVRNGYVQDPLTVFHTQRVESLWTEGKGWMHRARELKARLHNYSPAVRSRRITDSDKNLEILWFDTIPSRKVSAQFVSANLRNWAIQKFVQYLTPWIVQQQMFCTVQKLCSCSARKEKRQKLVRHQKLDTIQNCGRRKSMRT